MTIREATREDVPHIVGILAADDLGQHREDASEPLDAAYFEAFEAIRGDPDNLLVVLEDDGEVVGTLQLTFIAYLGHRGGLRGQIESVYIARSHQGIGRGRELVTWAIEESRRRGCHLVQLTTNVVRTDARAFYESLGFEATHHGMKHSLEGDVTGR